MPAAINSANQTIKIAGQNLMLNSQAQKDGVVDFFSSLIQSPSGLNKLVVLHQCAAELLI